MTETAPSWANTTCINTGGKPLRVVAVADLHVCSNVALANMESADARHGGPGADTREALYEAWKDATHGPWGQPDICIVNGDLIEGQNRKRAGAGLWETDPLTQVAHAAELLRMWDAKQYYFVWGSSYHVELANSRLKLEELVAQKVGGQEYPGQGRIPSGRRAHGGWQWYLHIDGVTFHVSHHISVSRVFAYQTTPTARQMLQGKLNDQLRHVVARQTQYKIQVIVRAHAHYYNLVDFSGSTGVVLPCWKGLDEYMQERGALDISPDIGFVGFTVNNGKYIPNKQLWRFDEISAAPLTIVDAGR